MPWAKSWTYSISVKKSIRSPEEALFQYVNKASATDGKWPDQWISEINSSISDHLKRIDLIKWAFACMFFMFYCCHDGEDCVYWLYCMVLCVGSLTLRHALEDVQEAHEEALDLRLIQFVTAQQGAAKGRGRLVLERGESSQDHRQTDRHTVHTPTHSLSHKHSRSLFFTLSHFLSFSLSPSHTHTQ